MTSVFKYNVFRVSWKIYKNLHIRYYLDSDEIPKDSVLRQAQESK